MNATNMEVDKVRINAVLEFVVLMEMHESFSLIQIKDRYRYLLYVNMYIYMHFRSCILEYIYSHIHICIRENMVKCEQLVNLHIGYMEVLHTILATLLYV